jgi:type II secretory pathway component PulF
MNARIRSTAKPPALADFILLNEELAALVRAKIPLESNLARLGRQLPRRSAALAQGVSKRLESGDDLVSAIEAECASIPASYRAALIAGVDSGNVGAALQAIVESAARLDRLRHVTLAAMLYPLILVILVCWLLAFVLTRVVPAFAWVEHSPLRHFLWLSQSEYTVPILTVVIPAILVVRAVFWWWRSGRLGGSTPRLGILAALAGSGRIFRAAEAARFAELLRLLVERGLPLDQSLRLAADATGDQRLRSAALEFANQIQSGDTPNGTKPGDVAIRHYDFPVFIRLALHHADNRPLLIGGLQQAAAMYNDRATRAADWYTEYLPIIMTIAIGGTFTIGFALFVLWPYASMLYELSDWNWQ